ncbi:MAG: rhodanese-like domain-containing protein [Geobacteraceae bacterium]|nr:rhodanese-like domain-containing protein [Geobacteraceae bacterium]
MIRIIAGILMLLAVITLAAAPSDAAEPFTVVSAVELKAMIDGKDPALVVIDSRSREEFEAAHISGAVSLPYQELAADRSLLDFPANAKLVFYCSGST